MIYHKIYMKDDKPSTQWMTLVHGAGGSSTIWFKQVREFKKHYNVLLVDLRGHGKSRNFITDKEYTFEEVAGDIIEVMDSIGVSKSHFVGISLGTIVIRAIAEIDESRLITMTLGGAVTRLTVRPKLFISIGNALKRVLPYMWLYNIFAFAIMPHREHRESRALFVNEAKKLCQKEFLRWFKLTSHINPLLKMFEEKEVNVPTLYIMGEEDYMFLGPVEEVARKHKMASLFVVKDSGHVCNVDQPEIFNNQTILFTKNKT